MNPIRGQFIPRLFARLEQRSRWPLILVVLALLVLIGLVDYLSGFEILFSAFYLVEVGLAAWFVGRAFGLLMAVLSVVFWIGGDVAAGARYSNPVVPVWNALILLALAAQFVAGKTLATGSPAELLSDRELEVFELLGGGQGTRQISEMLGVSIKTVQAYCARIKEKLNLASATELVREAVRWRESSGK